MNSVIYLIIIILLVLLILTKGKKDKKESFTPDEMIEYPNALNANCDRMKNVLYKLRDMNKRCNFTKGRTERDTINNRRICYDDIGKEIVANLDSESNCVMSDLINKKYKFEYGNYMPLKMSISSKQNNKKDKRKKHHEIDLDNYNMSKLSENLKPEEGPEFINTFFIPGVDSNKSGEFSKISSDNIPIGTSHKYPASAPYDDVSRISSDPGFLCEMAKYKKIEPIEGIEK